MRRAIPLILRLQALLLRLYPRRFRAEFAEEMQTTFAEAVIEASRHGKIAVMRLLLREWRDWPGAVIRAHWQERMNRVNAQTMSDERISWRAMLAALALFVIPCLYEIVNDQGLPTSLMFILFPVLAISFLALFLIGAIKGFPRWAWPSLGFVLTLVAFLGLMALGSWLEPRLGHLPGFRAMPGNEEGRLREQAIQSGVFWIGRLLIAGLTVLTLAAVPPLRPAFRRLRRDWTVLSFVLYGSAIGTVAFAFEDYSHDVPYQIASMVFIAAGAWVYLRSHHAGQRLLALLIGIVLSMGAIAVGKWLIVPLQDWPQWLAWHPPQVERRFESLRTVAEMGWMLLAIAAPAVLAL